MAGTQHCPDCGFEYASSSATPLSGLCPRCLANAAIDPGTEVDDSVPSTTVARIPAALPAGTRFRDLEILELLGSGGMGAVYKARQKNLDRLVALKIILPQLASAPEFVARFEREAKILASLNHPGIVHVYDFGRENDLLFLAMEHVPGRALDQVFADKKPVDAAWMLRVIRDVAMGLQAVHLAGLVHRDVKPSNILLSQSGSAKLTDFGLAIEAEETKRLTETGMFVGTPHYVSPEHVQGKKVDGRSDLYSLGIILYQGLAGRTPFNAPSTSALLMKHVQEAPPPLHKVAPQTTALQGEIVRKLLAKNPASRYDTAASLARDLDRALEEVRTSTTTAVGSRPALVSATPDAPARKLWPWIAAGAAAALIAGIVLLMPGKSEPPPPPVAVKPAPPVARPPAKTEPEPVTPPEKVVETPSPAVVAPEPTRPAAENPFTQALKAAERLLADARTAYERAKAAGSPEGFTEAAFKAEDARVKFMAIQELGQGEAKTTAIERVNQIQQLLKLIHEGRLAVSGVPAEPAANKPAAEPVVNPVVKPAAVDAPATKSRAAIPDAAKQREAEKGIRDVFRTDFEKKNPADKAALGRLLLRNSRTQTEPAMLWTMLRLSQEQAAAGGDADLGFEAADAAAAAFDCDPLALKLAVLAGTGKLAKGAEDATALAGQYLRVADGAVRLDQYDAAGKASAAALAWAKRANVTTQTARVAARDKEIAEMKARFDRSKKARETLSKSPDDAPANLEVGQFLCLYKGDWTAGLPLLAKGGDGPLATLAARELSQPGSAADQSALADAWWDLSDKETAAAKSALRKHSALWYERALPGMLLVTRAKAEKRLTEVELADAGSINLLRLVDPSRDTVSGEWRWVGDTLVGSPSVGMRFLIPYQPPDEYDLTMEFTAGSGPNPLGVLLVAGGSQFAVTLDAWGKSGLELIDKKDIMAAPIATGTSFLSEDTLKVLLISVRRKGLAVTLNGAKVFSWDGAYSRLSVNPDWKVPDPRALAVSCWDRPVTVRRITLLPVSGQGHRLR